MRKAITSVLVLVLFPLSLVFAQSSYEQYYNKAQELVNAGDFQGAIAQFEQAKLENPDIVDPYLNMGICYGKLNQFDKAIDAFSLAQALFPNDWRAPYWLSFTYFYTGQVGQALKNYKRAKELGIVGQDDVAQLLAQYEPTEFDIEYQPSFNKENNQPITIHIKGNPGLDRQLTLDAIKQLEKMEFLEHRGIFNQIDVEFIGWEKEQTLVKEKWTVYGPQGSKEYWIKFDFKPPADFPYKTMISVSDKE